MYLKVPNDYAETDAFGTLPFENNHHSATRGFKRGYLVLCHAGRNQFWDWEDSKTEPEVSQGQKTDWIGNTSSRLLVLEKNVS